MLNTIYITNIQRQEFNNVADQIKLKARSVFTTKNMFTNKHNNELVISDSEARRFILEVERIQQSNSKIKDSTIHSLFDLHKIAESLEKKIQITI